MTDDVENIDETVSSEATMKPPASDEAAKDEMGDQTDISSNSGSEDTTQEGATQDGENSVAEPDELAIYKDRLLRLQADFDNYRKRQARDQADWIRQANADLLEALLPVLDQTDQALASLEQNKNEATKPYLDGFALVRKTFLGAVAKFGLEPIPSAVGKPLDTDSAEAISTLPPQGDAKPGEVLFEVRKGYKLGGKVLRAAQVVVATSEEE